MNEEIKEILDKMSNRKQETLIQGLRECQLKDIEHPFITKEEYIDKLLNYIKDLQQKVEQLEKENKELRDENKRIFQNVNDDELLISNAMNYAEVQRLNNIINELEKWLKDNLSICRTNQEYSSNKFYTLKESIYYTVLKKLQELKDSD